MKILKLKFSHKEGELVVFKTGEGEDIFIPSKYIPFEVKEGSNLYLTIQKRLTDNGEREKHLAKAVLEEILNGGE